LLLKLLFLIMNDIKLNPIDEEFARRKFYREQAANEQQYSRNSVSKPYKRGPGVGISIVLIVVGLIFAVYLVKSFVSSKPKATHPTAAAPVYKILHKHHKRKHTFKSTAAKDSNVAVKDAAVVQPVKVTAIKQTELGPAPAKKTESLTIKPITTAPGFLYSTYVRPNITGIVNMRESDHYGSVVTGVIPADSKVYVIEKGPGYYKVSYNGSVGYVPKWALERK
jgi:hypothetical protein